MKAAPENEFYVGYLDPAPPGLGRRMRALAVCSLVVAIGAAVAVGLGQRRLPEATFEFGTIVKLDGYLAVDPYPSLLVVEGAGVTRHLLVGYGKRGVAAEALDLSDRWVSLEAMRIHRDGQTMLQIEPGSVLEMPEQRPAPSPEAVEDLGVRYVEGEIVGSKCYLGVMNPGSGVAHRACANHCIRGGVPPMLAVTHLAGETEGLLLVDEDGEPLGDTLLDLAAAPVGVTGRVVRVGATTFIHVDATNIRRLE